MKKLLLLGGSAQQVVAIETAKRMGIYTILCDYLTDNPGQYTSDKFCLVSTTDKEAVLEVAKKNSVDGVLAYASDPAAPTAAYVAERLGLPGNSYESVKILCNKDSFRSYLKQHSFNVPEFGGYTEVDEAVRDCKDGKFKFPIIVKPADSSGSKGVVKIDSIDDLEEKIQHSMCYSGSGKIVLEEYVQKLGYQIAGDGLSINGDLVFCCFGNDHFSSNNINPFVPISASFPYNMPRWVEDSVKKEIQRLIHLLGMKDCTYNFDIRIDSNYNVYLMEVAPRSGGNYIPQVIQYATGVDLVKCAVEASVGEAISIPSDRICSGFWSYYAVHSPKNGVLDEVKIQPEILSQCVVENHIIRHPGDEISAFTGANSTLGCLIMKFDSMEQMLHMMDHGDEWVHVILRE